MAAAVVLSRTFPPTLLVSARALTPPVPVMTSQSFGHDWRVFGNFSERERSCVCAKTSVAFLSEEEEVIYFAAAEVNCWFSASFFSCVSPSELFNFSFLWQHLFNFKEFLIKKTFF